MAPNITTVKTTITDAQAKVATDHGRAYVTFLAGNGDYVKGVVGLAKGLRKVKSMYPLVVAVLPDVPQDHRNILTSQGCIVREFSPCTPQRIKPSLPWHITSSTIPSYVFGSKMIYLDGDIQVFDNIDHLFDLPDNYFYAVMDCFCEPTWGHTKQYQIGYCQQCPHKVQWPTHFGPKPPLYFNAGMFVYEPNLATYRDLLQTVQVTQPTSFAEQDFLNMYFKDKYRPIPNVYNLVLAMLWRHPENVELDKVKVVHYCAAGSKPWRYTGKEENMEREDIKMLVKKWWDIYEDETLDYNNPLNVDKFTAALMEVGEVKFVRAPSAA
ncbi:hypothetical protein JHK84_028430 [Glycine max]|nr:hypothetical protein JHK84_028430 [Glycine max]